MTDGVTLWLPVRVRRKRKTQQGSPIANGDLLQGLHARLQERQAPTEGIQVPSHGGLHGNGMVDTRADLGVQQRGVRMQGQEQPTPKRQADAARDGGRQELGSQGPA